MKKKEVSVKVVKGLGYLLIVVVISFLSISISYGYDSIVKKVMKEPSGVTKLTTMCRNNGYYVKWSKMSKKLPHNAGYAVFVEISDSKLGMGWWYSLAILYRHNDSIVGSIKAGDNVYVNDEEDQEGFKNAMFKLIKHCSE